MAQSLEKIPTLDTFATSINEPLKGFVSEAILENSKHFF